MDDTPPPAAAETKRLSAEQLNERMAKAMAATMGKCIVWQHAKSGTYYEIVGVSLRPGDCEPMVTYRPLGHGTGLRWTREVEDFVAKFHTSPGVLG